MARNTAAAEEGEEEAKDRSLNQIKIDQTRALGDFVVVSTAAGGAW